MTRLNLIPESLKDQIPTDVQPEKRQKYNARRAWSEVCQRWFASKGECELGQGLYLLQQLGAIHDLQYQVKFVLCEKPRVSITIDFAYRLPDRTDLPARAHPDQKIRQVYEDYKGVMTRDFRTKLAWLREKYGIEVKIIKKSDGIVAK